MNNLDKEMDNNNTEAALKNTGNFEEEEEETPKLRSRIRETLKKKKKLRRRTPPSPKPKIFILNNLIHKSWIYLL
jgi:carbamate kinase